MEKKVHLTVQNNTAIKQELIHQVENTVLMILQQISQRQIPKLTCLTSSSATDSENHDQDYTLEPEIEEVSQQVNSRVIVDFGNSRGQLKMTRMMTVLAQAHQLLVSKKIQTKRSFYYELKGSPAAALFDQQSHVDHQVVEVANLLQCPTWQLGFIASAKGLMAGNLILRFQSGDVINGTLPGGVLIPQIESSNTGEIEEIHFSATSILVVEKESVFQKLLDENCPRCLKTLLITGKGYPDVATRYLVALLAKKLQLPVYIMVDSNPHGFEIMCTYKYGSSNLWWERDHLICPTMKWIGVYPSELVGLHLPRLVLNENDKMKLKALKRRSYLDVNECEELSKMQGGKAEIETLISITTSSFLTNSYLPTKILQYLD